jgi:hypothetical protein
VVFVSFFASPSKSEEQMSYTISGFLYLMYLVKV